MFSVWILAVDSVLKRMTIIGVILSFRSLAQEALRDVRHLTTNTLQPFRAQPVQNGYIQYNDLFNALLFNILRATRAIM